MKRKTAEEYAAQYIAAGQTPHAVCQIYEEMAGEVEGILWAYAGPVVTPAFVGHVLDRINGKWIEFAQRVGVGETAFARMYSHNSRERFQTWNEARLKQGKPSLCAA